MPIVSYSTSDLKANSSVLDKILFFFSERPSCNILFSFSVLLVNCCHEDCGTFRVDSSLPAKARSRLVLPDPGDPSKKVILQKYTPAIRLHSRHGQLCSIFHEDKKNLQSRADGSKLFII